MAESDLYPLVRDWLKCQGYTVHVELFDADVIATRPNSECRDGIELCAVELKGGATQKLLDQCMNRTQWADKVYAAVPVEPKFLGGFKFAGIGVVVVDVAAGTVKRKVKPQYQPHGWRKRRAYRLKRLECAPAAADAK